MGGEKIEGEFQTIDWKYEQDERWGGKLRLVFKKGQWSKKKRKKRER